MLQSLISFKIFKSSNYNSSLLLIPYVTFPFYEIRYSRNSTNFLLSTRIRHVQIHVRLRTAQCAFFIFFLPTRLHEALVSFVAWDHSGRCFLNELIRFVHIKPKSRQRNNFSFVFCDEHQSSRRHFGHNIVFRPTNFISKMNSQVRRLLQLLIVAIFVSLIASASLG